MLPPVLSLLGKIIKSVISSQPAVNNTPVEMEGFPSESDYV